MTASRTAPKPPNPGLRLGPEECEVLRVSQIARFSRSEGPGLRFVVWLQGCLLRCVDCCNSEMLDPDDGEERTNAELIDELEKSTCEGVVGLTILGGEPFHQSAGAASLAEAARELKLGVLVFTGYSYDLLRAAEHEGCRRLLAATDLLVDGPFLSARKSARRRWIGSENQEMYFLTPRYLDHPDIRNDYTQSVDVQVGSGEMLVTGWPDLVDGASRKLDGGK